MNKVITLAALLFFAGFMASEVLAASVRGYYRSDGTYVPPHQRTNPDGNPYNNYGFPGNYNPNTGRTTPGDPGVYLERYYGTPRGSGGMNISPNPYSR